jgi:itaconate CoA-transferase
LRDRPIDEVLSALARARIAFSRLNDVAALSAHPHLRRVSVTHPHGVAEIPAPPVRTDWERVGAVPDVDQHGAEVRAVVESADHRG